MGKAPEGFSYIDRAIASATEESQGRFAKPTPTFPGGVQYPKLPEDNAQNQHAKVPDEPPLGWSVSAPIVTGEFFEVVPPPEAVEAGAQVAPTSPISVVETLEPRTIEREDGTPMPTSLDVHKLEGR
jgi:hypothetical protein